MTARKPKPRKAAVRKGSGPTLEQRVTEIEAFLTAQSSVMVGLNGTGANHTEQLRELRLRMDAAAEGLREHDKRLDDLESNGIAFSDHLKAHDRHFAALDLRKQFRDASHDAPVSNAGEAVGVPLTPAQLARLMAYEGKRWWQFWRRL